MDFNRFCQKFRRLHNTQVQYLRVVEEHKDTYPHIHVILQFPDARLSITNSRYFDRILYKKWKTLWISGHSDYQTMSRGGVGGLRYILKYLVKNTTRKTLYKKIYTLHPVAIRSSTTPPETRRTKKPERLPIKKNGVKLATWSRCFDFVPFYMPLPSNAQGLLSSIPPSKQTQ